MRRSPLRRFGKRAQREREAIAAFREVVFALADWKCERCGESESALHAHHVLPRSRGGKHEAENGACLCFTCHAAVHDHTADDWRRWVR